MGRVVFQACSEGLWELAGAVPDPRLRPGVRSYRGFRLDLGKPRRRLELPVDVVTLVLSFDRHLLHVGSALDCSAPMNSFTSSVSGVHTRATVGTHDGCLHGVEVNLSPWAAFTLFDTPLHQLANTMVAPTDLIGTRAQALADTLASAPDWSQRFALLDAALIRWMAAGRACSPRVVLAWDTLVRTGGQIPIRVLAARVGWSQQHLERRFREQIGVLPKAGARVIRLQRVLRMLAQGWSAAQCAQDCGFTDQAHLSREFTAMTGCTVSQFLVDRARPHDGPSITDRVNGHVTSLVLPASAHVPAGR